MSKVSDSAQPSYTYRFSDVEFNEAAWSLTVAGARVDAEQRPLRLLSALLAQVDEVVTKAELLSQVWDDRPTVDNVLANAVTKLRKALGESAAERIITHPRIGYRLTGPVERLVSGRKLASAFELRKDTPIHGRENYLLRRQLSAAPGREVWRAEHAKTGEPRVFKFAADGSGLASIKREVTLYRLLRNSYADQAQVVTIHDWNFAEAPFFIECDYIGRDLVSWAAQDNQLKQAPLSERVEIALAIIDTLADVHQAGILHKDLKPTNVLVREASATQSRAFLLADFGVGRLLGRDALDAYGLTPLGLTLDDETSGATPNYQAPELARGQAPSVRSDVYALGILVYQILRGDVETPLTANWRETLDDADYGTFLQADIAAATKEDPSERLANAEALGERLRKLAARREAQDRVREEQARQRLAQQTLDRARTRRPWVAAASLFLVTGMAVSSVFAWRADQARLDAQREARSATAAREFLQELISSADPRTPGLTQEVSVKVALERAASLVQERFEDDLATQADLSVTLANVFSGISDFSAEISARRQAVELFTQINGSANPITLNAQLDLADAFIRNSQLNQAASVLDEVTDYQNKQAETFTTLHVRTHRVRGTLQLHQLDLQGAVNSLESAVKIAERTGLGSEKESIVIRHDLAQALSRLGKHDRAIEILAMLLDPQAPHTQALSDWRRADLLLAQGAAHVFALRNEEALKILDQARIAMVDIFGSDSRKVGDVYGMLGNAHSGLGDWEAASHWLNQARALTCKNNGEDHSQCLSMTANSGIALIELGDFLNAEAQVRKVRNAFLNRAGAEHPAVLVLNYQLARALLALNQLAEVAELIATLRPDAMESAAPGNHWATRVKALRGRYQIRAGQTQTGQQLLTSAIEEMHKLSFPKAFVSRHEQDLAF